MIKFRSEIVDKMYYDSNTLFVNTTKSNISWEYHLLKKFEEAANSDSPFSLPQSVFNVNTNTISAHQTWRVERINVIFPGRNEAY